MGWRRSEVLGADVTGGRSASRALAKVLLVGGFIAAIAGVLWAHGPPGGELQGLVARLAVLLRGDRCAFSGREIHPETAVRVEVEGGEVITACCLRCAITESTQTHKRIRVISVNDFNTSHPLSPAQAVYVVGSDVAPCACHGELAAPNGVRSLYCAWDRCLPSALAFENAQTAEAFRAEHGGRIETFAQLTASLNVVAAR